jgi:tetratricopeptide (TPR) repeat protein
VSQHRAGTDDTLAAGAASGATMPTVSDAARGSRPSLTSSPDHSELRVVDPADYALVREIARGGMGRIWAARDLRLGRDVALKEILVDNAAAVRRFEREARITARLQHPSIVSVHEAGMWPSGEPFYAMRLVSGRSLDETIASTASFDDRLALLPNVLAVADAMAYAHGQRVIHRDLKPRNVVVGDFGETVVIDWGLAKDLTAPISTGNGDDASPIGESASVPGETNAGDILGTPVYMPPEQAAGAAVDERVDVYAIGAMLYHVLANEPPYHAKNNAEVIAAVMTGPPPPVSERAPATPTELVAIVERAMARDPAGRYPTARELADDLRRFQTGQLVGAHRYSTGQLVRRWLRRHRTAIAAVAAAAIVAVAIGVVALERIFKADALAEQQRSEAVANRKAAENLTQFMIRDLENKLVLTNRPDLIDAVANRAVAYYDARGATGSDEDLYELAAARNVLGGGFHERHDAKNAAIQFHDAQLALAMVVARNPTDAGAELQLLRVRSNLASMLPDADGEQPLREIAADADQLVARDPKRADTLHEACTLHSHVAAVLAQHDPAASLAESTRSIELADALDAIAKDEPQNERVVIAAHQWRGELLRRLRNDTDGALAEYRRGLAIADRTRRKHEHVASIVEMTAGLHSTIGDVLAARRDFAGAEREYRDALTLAENLHHDDPASADGTQLVESLDEGLGDLLEADGDHAAALARYRTCDAMLGELIAADPAAMSTVDARAVVIGKLAGVQAGMLQAADALASYNRAAELERSLVARDPDNPAWPSKLATTDESIASVLLHLKGRELDALSVLRDALALATKLADDQPTSSERQLAVALVHANLGDARLALRDRAGARTELALALEIAGRQPASADDSHRLALVARARRSLAQASGRPN